MVANFLVNRSIEKATNILGRSKRILVVTGAGISASAGIPTFRSSGGLWKSEDIAKFGDPQTWVEDPWSCWFAYENLRSAVDDAKPTAAHKAIKRLSETFSVNVVTTNVDSLHKRSGVDALEIHGTLRNLRCMMCGHCDELGRFQPVMNPACKKCGNWRRHDVVLWGESIKRFEEYQDLLDQADCLVLVGLSGMVTQTGDVSKQFRRRGGSVIEINPSTFTPATLHTSVSIRTTADRALEGIVRSLVP